MTLLTGDSRTILPTLPFESIDCVVTSPPYFNLRNYGIDGPIGGTVLDPFCGSGTTGKVAHDLGRYFIGIDLNPEYISIAEKRIGSTRQTMLEVT